MANPGLAVFAFGTIRTPGHPLNIDPYEDDPYLDEGENDSDYVPPINFGRWRNPGHPLVPTHVGPAFAPGEKPEDVIHGEVISPEEEAGADGILKGEHESDSPSANPDVETARRDLHTPGSSIAVSALSKLLRGARPESMGQDALDAAHEWLKRRFTGLKVNPAHGTLVAASPTGTQMVKRETHLPAIPDREPEPTYTLTNKHGVFESHDPQQVVRALVAFQIMHNAIERRKKDEDDNNSLSSTSGFLHRIRDALDSRSKPSFTPPPGAVFEPGHGIDVNQHGVRGGYVTHSSAAPPGWLHDGEGTAYSPGHDMRLMLDPNEAINPRFDPRFKGHTFTYAPNHATGHLVQRNLNGLTYYVQNRIHPAARGSGFDLPSSMRTPPAPRSAPRAPRVDEEMDRGRAPRPPRPRRSPRPTRVDEEADRGIASAPPPASASASLPAPAPAPRWRWVGEGEEPVFRFDGDPGWTRESSVQVNDLCPVCASGYLEPYDRDFHECLNCGSLVKHVGFEKQAARKAPRGGLGRGLNQIMEYQGDPLNLASGGSENPENTDQDALDDEGYAHPLADEELDPDYIGYQAPRNILGAFSNSEQDQKLNADLYWRTFPSSVAPGLVPGHDAHNAEQQVREAEDNFGGGLGRWWSPTREGAAFYGGPGNVLVGARIDSSDLKDPEHSSGLIARRPAQLAIEHVAVGEPDGSWTDLDVPPGLTSWTHRPVDHVSSVGDPIDEFMGKQGFQPIHREGQPRTYLAPLTDTPGAYARLTEGTPRPDGGPAGWVLTADHIPYREQWMQGDQPYARRDLTHERLTTDPKPKPFKTKLPDLGDRVLGQKTFLASGTHPIEDDRLNRAIRQVAKGGRSSTPYWNAFDSTAYEPPRLPGEHDEGTQKEKRILSSVGNPGLSRFVS